MTISNLNLAEFESIEMDFGGTACWGTVPAVPGWYAIETNAPLEVLAQFPVPAAGSRHYLIAQRLQEAEFLLGQGAVIVPASKGAPYIVYSGEHGDLKARAREHIRGSKGTGCLSLSQYEVAKAYQWTFYYRPCEEHVPGSEGNKTLRNYLEQNGGRRTVGPFSAPGRGCRRPLLEDLQVRRPQLYEMSSWLFPSWESFEISDLVKTKN